MPQGVSARVCWPFAKSAESEIAISPTVEETDNCFQSKQAEASDVPFYPNTIMGSLHCRWTDVGMLVGSSSLNSSPLASL